jgi:hypothetical protein
VSHVWLRGVSVAGVALATQGVKGSSCFQCSCDSRVTRCWCDYVSIPHNYHGQHIRIPPKHFRRTFATPCIPRHHPPPPITHHPPPPTTFAGGVEWHPLRAGHQIRPLSVFNVKFEHRHWKSCSCTRRFGMRFESWTQGQLSYRKPILSIERKHDTFVLKARRRSLKYEPW